MLTMSSKMFLIWLAVVALVLVLPGSMASCRGCVELDDLTFDKMVSRFPVTIIKFDIAYPYGTKHENYANFADDVATADVADLLVAVVGIKDYGEKDNEVLGKRFKVRAQFPDIKLLANGTTESWIDYPADQEITAENLKQFVRQYSSVYIGLAGCTKVLDDQAQLFMNIDAKDNEKRRKALEQTELLVADQQKKSSQSVYLILMKRIIEKGDAFVNTEKQRVRNLIENGQLTDNKRNELQIRLNILRAFELSPIPAADDSSKIEL